MRRNGRPLFVIALAAMLVSMFVAPSWASASRLARSRHIVYRSSVVSRGHGQFTYTLAGGFTLNSAALARSTSSFSGGTAMTPANLGSYTDCMDDASLSVEDCAQLDYDTYVCTGTYHCGTINDVYLTYYNHDPHDVSLVNRKWIEGASGPCYRGCSTYSSGTHAFAWRSVTGGTTYHYAGYWAGTYTLLDKTNGSQRGGTSKLNWDYRGTEYQLDIHPKLNDNGDGGSDR